MKYSLIPTDKPVGLPKTKKRLGQSLSEKHKVFATYVKEEYIGTMGCPTSSMLYEAE